ncbi:MAG: NADH-quinone oxidoreductase subunit M, partial [Chloroflexi bacterium]|nr:NADH-quinone oxidoreductase subunit M [Chloroflexota bacterium]
MAATENSLGFPLLTIILFLPAAGGFVCMALDDVRSLRIVAAAVAVVDFILAMILLAKFTITGTGVAARWVFQFSDRHDWVGGLGINYLLGVDGIAVFLVGLTTLMMGIAILASCFMIADRVKLFMIFMLFLETGILGVFMATNLFLFYVFWEAMLIPMYFLLGMWGEEERVYATMKFLVYTIFGSFLMLVAIFYLWAKEGTLDMVTSSGLIDRLQAHPLSSTEQTWLFLAFAIAFAIKLPVWPFHTWAPTAYSASPIPVVIALAGILSKAGAFGFLRYCLPLFPQASRSFAGLVSVLCIIGMLYAAGLALVQTDIKRLVAYSSVSHMNLIGLGIFALNPTGIEGSVLQMINHSVIISGLFIAVAYIAARSGTRMLTGMGGLGARWPVLMWLFFIFVLAGLDLPGLSSFAGEFLILAGVFKANAWFSSIAALTVILAAWYMIRFFQDTMNGPLVASPERVAATVEDPERTPYQYPVARRLIGSDLLR